MYVSMDVFQIDVKHKEITITMPTQIHILKMRIPIQTVNLSLVHKCRNCHPSLAQDNTDNPVPNINFLSNTTSIQLMRSIIIIDEPFMLPQVLYSSDEICSPVQKKDGEFLLLFSLFITLLPLYYRYLKASFEFRFENVNFMPFQDKQVQCLLKWRHKLK